MHTFHRRSLGWVLITAVVVGAGCTSNDSGGGRAAGALQPSVRKAVAAVTSITNGYSVCGPFVVEGSGGPVNRAFSCPRPSTPGPYRLLVRSGRADGTGRPASARLDWNGQAVATPDNFNANVVGVSRLVSFQQENTLRVSASGAGVVLQVEVVDESEVCHAAGPYAVSAALPLDAHFTWANAGAQPELQLFNGNESGEAPAKQGRVWLNGNPIVRGQELKDEVSAVLVPVALANTNRLQAEVLQGGQFRLQIVDRDSVAPTVNVTQPAPGQWTNQPVLTVTGTVDDTSAAVTVNGAAATVSGDGHFTGQVLLQEGDNTLEIVAADACRNRSAIQLIARLDATPPAVAFTAPTEGSTATQSTQAVTLTYSDVLSGIATDTVRVRLDGQDVTAQLTVGATEATGTLTCTEGPHALVAQVADRAGNAAEATVHFTVAAQGPPPLPPDPITVAPPLDPNRVTPFAEATAFLYTGPNPIQVGVAAGTLEAKRVAVLRGQVQTRDGAPLSGVTISILHHLEFGHTLSRADGRWDMAVNGGGLLTVQYAKQGYLSAQRQLQTRWADYAPLPDVDLVPLDSAVTVVELNGANTAIQVARGSLVTDRDGTRQATLLFAPGTQASLVLPGGGSQALSTLHVRTTEYTVGDAGPTAMPGTLPASSGYTYAAELSVDEALAAGATEVTFTRPVAVYVDNFLGFPVGSPVPAGYYDRQEGQWLPSDNGRVLKILNVTAGRASVDADGDGLEDTSGALAALGITEAELLQLGSLYSPETTLWRAPVTHFTPWDYNWPYGPPEDAAPPRQPPPEDEQPEEEPDSTCGSIIDCQNQTLGEALPVVGTPFRLHYQSSRVPGRQGNRTLDIPLSGASVPASLRSIVLQVTVAGRTFQSAFPAAPQQRTAFQWDGRDSYGRLVQGQVPVHVRIGYVYPLVYQQPAQFAQAFARISGVPISAQREQGEIMLVQAWDRLLGAWTAPLSLGGWTLALHHTYDAAANTLYLGNGERRTARSIVPLTTVAGNGSDGFSGDGSLATQASLSTPVSVAVGPDGSLFIASYLNSRIRRVSPDGLITTVAGNGRPGFSGDGGPATQASLDRPSSVAVGPEGSLFIATPANARIRRVGPDGRITTVAGNGSYGFSGDGGPATQAMLSYYYGVAVGPDGSLFIADMYNNRVRRVGPDGLITTVAGNGNAGFSGDGGPATQAMLYDPSSVAVGPDGSLFIADVANYRIRRVGPDGRITTVAGNGNAGFSGDGGPATQASVSAVFGGLAVGPDGSLFIGDSWYNNRIRRVDPDGRITTVAGNGNAGFSGDGSPATQSMLYDPYGVAMGPDGSLFIADYLNHRIRCLKPFFPGTAVDGFLAAEGGQEAYLFDNRGRHLQTRDALTNARRYTFSYDAVGRLSGVADGDGLVTRIEHDAAGAPTALVAPHGQRTLLTVDAQGYLASITNPVGERVELTSTPDGLLTSLKDARGGLHTFTYDTLGRLLQDSNPAGGSKTLARTGVDRGYRVAVTTALGRSTVHGVENLPAGGQRRTTTMPSGEVSLHLRGNDDTESWRAPDGTVTTTVQGPDLRFGLQAPLVTSATVRLPSGLTSMTTHTQAATVVEGGSPWDVVSLTDTVTVNGQASTRVYTAATRTLTTTSPLGRTVTMALDAKGRVTRTTVPGLLPVQYTYDSEGRLAAVTQGTRTSTVAYNAQGWPSTITDALGRTSTLTTDAAGRVTVQVLPGNRTVAFSYDPGSNLTSLTPPGQPAHAFAYTPADSESRYTPPAVPGAGLLATTRIYDLDNALTDVALPDGTHLQARYTDGGQFASVSTARTTVGYGYDSAGRLTTLTDSAGGSSLALSYNGPLLTQETWNGGGLSGGVGYTYNADFRVASVAVNDTSVAYGYDNDGLLVGAGTLTLTRDAQTGLVTGTAIGSLTTAHTWTGYGELGSLSAASNGTTLFSEALTRDTLGRITSKTEIIQGVSHTDAYGYDTAGRLSDVSRDGTSLAHYTYDANGNRTAVQTNGATISASFDAQDRLRTQGSTSYSDGPNGDLQTRIDGSGTTQYAYDALGALASVQLPDGRRVDYVLDAAGRRVGKRINGTLMQGWLCQGALRPVAELDGTGNVVSRFVYATHVNVPDYLVRGGVTYRLVTNHLGSVRLVVNAANGTVAQRLDYDAWGNVILDTAPGFQPFGFAGGLYDADTKLVRFGARDYDAETGRWTTKDPLRFGGGDTNLYTYVANDPVNLIDPSGLCFKSAFAHTFKYDWNTTNHFFFTFPGSLVRTGLGILATGAVAQETGLISPLDALRSLPAGGLATMGVGGTIGSAVGHVLVKGAAIAAALEVGITVGSALDGLYAGLTDDAPCPEESSCTGK